MGTILWAPALTHSEALLNASLEPSPSFKAVVFRFPCVSLQFAHG